MSFVDKLTLILEHAVDNEIISALSSKLSDQDLTKLLGFISQYGDIPIVATDIMMAGGFSSLDTIYISRSMFDRDILCYSILHELGHITRTRKEPGLFYLFISRDVDGNEIDMNEAVRRIADEEEAANKFASQAIKDLGLSVLNAGSKRPPDAMMASYKMLIQKLRMDGVETVPEIIENILNMVIQ